MAKRKPSKAQTEAARRAHREQIEADHQARLETMPIAPAAHRTGMYYGSEALVVRGRPER